MLITNGQKKDRIYRSLGNADPYSIPRKQRKQSHLRYAPSCCVARGQRAGLHCSIAVFSAFVLREDLLLSSLVHRLSHEAFESVPRSILAIRCRRITCLDALAGSSMPSIGVFLRRWKTHCSARPKHQGQSQSTCGCLEKGNIYM